MKLITLNTHSLVEECYEEKLESFVQVIIKEQPTLFSLQEVNQSLESLEADAPNKEGYVAIKGENIIIREDNHALNVARLLARVGLRYEWTWVPIKVGYGMYEEGLAIFSLSPITEIKECYISQVQDYNNWKTRKILGIKNEEYSDVWFFTTHLGWWDDEEEPFSGQWDRANRTITDLVGHNVCYVMGDFNTPDRIRNQGYDYVKKSGWYDVWNLARTKDSGVTVGHVIDGWQDRLSTEQACVQGMRLDYIWCNKKVLVESCDVICNGLNYKVVSDHYGVMAEIVDA